MNQRFPILYLFSGLPGVGKTTLAQILASQINGVYLRIDTIETAIQELCSYPVQGEGYRLAYRVATDNLKLGNNVIADSCNPIQLTRTEWEAIAIAAGATYLNIEILCSDSVEHRDRVERRNMQDQTVHYPTWNEVENREYHPWITERLVIDTAHQSIDNSYQELWEKINRHGLFD